MIVNKTVLFSSAKVNSIANLISKSFIAYFNYKFK
jgi:hypothetical protein